MEHQRENPAFDQQYEAYRLAVEDCLSRQFSGTPAWGQLYEAMRYSLLSGGKRVRPVLTAAFAHAAGLDWRLAVPPGCALEMVHTYSLIHDDLPCMDDDDLRRGKPACHRAFGETLAVLAGDALQPEAFRLILTAPDLSLQARTDCALILARAAGADGMVAGQVVDTLQHPATEAALRETHRRKTGCMIAGACELGAAAAEAPPSLREAAREYGFQLGMAFQIRDDMLDVISSDQDLGKPVGSDREAGKTTFVDLLGLEACGQRVRACTERAKAAVASLDGDGFLTELAERLAEREK